MKNLKSKIYNLKFFTQHHGLFVALILLLALVLRLPLLSGSFWLDEAAQALESARPLSQQLEIAHDFQPPLMHLVVHFALYFGRGEAWLRFVGALVPGLITIWALMVVVKEVISCHSEHHLPTGEAKSLLRLSSIFHLPSLTSLLAGLLLATNTWHIFYSQELRPYSLPAMFATLSWLVLIYNLKFKIKNLYRCHSEFARREARLVSESQDRRSKTLDTSRTSSLSFILLSLFTTLGLYSSYLYPMLVLSQLIYLAYLWWSQPHQRRQIKVNGAALVVSGFFFLLWLPKLFEQLRVSAQLRQSLPTWQEVVSIPQAKGLFLVFAKFVYGVLRVDVSLGWVLVTLVVVGLATVLLVSTLRSSSWRRRLAPFLIWLVVPVVGSWLLSFFIPVLRPKRVLLALPALQAIWAVLITSNLKFKIKNSKLNISLVFLAILLTINAYSYFNYLTDPALQREPWRQAVAQVVSDYPDQTIAVFTYPNPYSPWRWYAPSDYPTLTTGKFSISEVKDLKKTLEPVKNYQQAVTFDYLTDLTDPERKLSRQLEEFGFKEVKAVAYPNLGVVRVYKIKN